MTALRQKAHELIDNLSEQQLVEIIGVLNVVQNKNEVEERLKTARSLHGIIPPMSDVGFLSTLIIRH